MKSKVLVSTEELKSEFQRLKDTTDFSVEQIPFSQLDGWYFQEPSGNLAHSSGKFFRIEGLRVKTDFPSANSWEQPIINQPEIGILGIIAKKIDGVRYFLMQAKAEPGNINTFQLSPTVQATKSNYTQVHKGKQPLFLDFFLNPDKSRVLIDQLQSEQGARFFRKRNRNLIIETDQEIDLPPNFYWLTLGQISELLRIDDFVNMDARSVLSCISGVAEQDNPLHGNLEINSWLEGFRNKDYCQAETIALKDIKDWQIGDREISHESGKFFSVVAVSVEAQGREVTNWSQPLLKQSSIGMIGFLTKKIRGLRHVLVQAKLEAGYIDTFELAPTVSFSDPQERVKQNNLPPFADIFLKVNPEQVKFSVIFSEEGGRFYQAQNKYMVVEVDEQEELELPPNYRWMSLGQLSEFTRTTSSVNIEARSLLSCLLTF